MGASYYQTIVLEEAAQKRADALGEFSEYINDIKINSLEARFYEKDFFLENDLEYLNSYNQHMTAVDESIKQLGENLRTSEDKKVVEEFQSIVDEYQNVFYEAVESSIEIGLTQDQGLSAAVKEALLAVEEQIKLGSDDHLNDEFSSLITLHYDYIAGGEKMVSAEQLSNSLQQFISNVEKTTFINETLKTNTIDALNELAEIDAEFSDVDFRLRSELDRLQNTIQKLNPQIEQVVNLTGRYAKLNDDQRATDAQDMVKLFFASMMLMTVALTIALSIMKYGVVDPVNRIQNTVNRVRDGDNDARTRLESKDELGQLATVLDTLLDEKEVSLAEKDAENKKINASIISLIQNVFRLSQRDLTVRVPVAEDITGAIADSINQLATSIETVLNDVNLVAVQVSDTSQQVKSQSSTVLNYAAREQEEIVQTLDGLESAIKAMQLISQLAKLSNTASQKAIKTSETAMESVSQTIISINKIRQTIHEAEKRIKRLGERSQEIGGIVSLINNISERTHILSLNASMHAASAGEAGRGLMVVVDEVQRLAENSREATAEIESLVNNIQLETADTIQVMNAVITDVVEGTRLAEEAGERMNETRETTETLVDSVMRIAQNAVKQAKVAEQLRTRASSIDATSQATNEEMQRQALLSDDLVTSADALRKSISVFKLASS